MLYFAYGSNLSTSQMRVRCPGSREAGAARLPDHRLSFASYSDRWKGGVATIRPDPAGVVPGLIYEITPDDLAALDEYEGYPDRYDRRVVEIRTAADALREAWVYILEGRPFRRPSERYLEIIRKAHERLGVPPTILEEALAGE